MINKRENPGFSDWMSTSVGSHDVWASGAAVTSRTEEVAVEEAYYYDEWRAVIEDKAGPNAREGNIVEDPG